MPDRADLVRQIEQAMMRHTAAHGPVRLREGETIPAFLDALADLGYGLAKLDDLLLVWARDKLADDIQALYDDPIGVAGDPREVREHLAQLGRLAEQLDMSVEVVVIRECTDFEVQRMERILARARAEAENERRSQAMVDGQR